jgi:hypothetical protein
MKLLPLKIPDTVFSIEIFYEIMLGAKLGDKVEMSLMGECAIHCLPPRS